MRRVAAPARSVDPQVKKQIEPIAPQRTAEDGSGSSVVDLGAETDLLETSIANLRKYTAEITAGNQFPVAEPPAVYDASVLTSAGNITDPSVGGQITYTTQDEPGFRSTSEDFGNEGKEVASDQAILTAGYGLSDEGIPDGGQPVAAQKSKISGYVSSVLTTNRFSGVASSQRFVDTEEGERSITSIGDIIPNQEGKGAYDPAGTGGRQLKRAGRRSNTEVAALSNVALRLLINATGHDTIGASIGRDSRAGNTRAQSLKAAALPSPAQLGVSKVDGDKLQAGKGVVSTPVSAEKGESLGYSGKPGESGKSYGVLNSPIEKFDDGALSGMTFQAIAGAVALLGVSTLLSTLISSGGKKMTLAEFSPSSLGKGGRSLVNTPNGLQFAKGSGSAAARVLQAAADIAGNLMPGLGVPELTHAFDECVTFGIRSFYGIDGSGGGFVNIASSPGYYATVMRRVVGDLEQVGRAARDSSNPIAGAQAVIEALGSSMTFKFVTTMATIGEAMLNDADRSKGPPENPGVRSGIGTTDVSSMNRGFLKLLPVSFLDSATVSLLTGNSVPLAAPGTISKRGVNLRPEINIEDVQAFERAIDAEYFPFTMHDLRTNEMVQFGAFITDVSDGFTANYEETEAYGRADAIMTYRSTKRSIDLSFVLASTNPEDHDIMWQKVNKLVSLVYPQYSKGRLISKGGNSFRMPFSQVMTSSPMIRIRLGEMITSNYSRFNLQRLFGTGDAGQGAQYSVSTSVGEAEVAADALFSMAGVSLNDTNASGEQPVDVFRGAIVEALAQIRTQYRAGFQAGQQAYLRREVHAVVDESGSRADRRDERRQLDPAKRGAARAQDRVQDRLVTKIALGANTPVKIIESMPGSSPRLYKVSIGDGGDSVFIVDEFSLILDPAPFVQNALDNAVGGQIDFEASFGDLNLETPEGRAEQLDRIANGDVTTTPAIFNTERVQDFRQAVTDFFTSDRNPIVRSFESSMSEGLAGFITSLNFDYSEAQYETAPGSRAPTMIKVQLSFSPIHDIPPGLDADGMDRAPLYRVGAANRQLIGLDGANSGVTLPGPNGAELPAAVREEQSAAANAFVANHYANLVSDTIVQGLNRAAEIQEAAARNRGQAARRASGEPGFFDTAQAYRDYLKDQGLEAASSMAYERAKEVSRAAEIAANADPVYPVGEEGVAGRITRFIDRLDNGG